MQRPLCQQKTHRKSAHTHKNKFSVAQLQHRPSFCPPPFFNADVGDVVNVGDFVNVGDVFNVGDDGNVGDVGNTQCPNEIKALKIGNNCDAIHTVPQGCLAKLKFTYPRFDVKLFLQVNTTFNLVFAIHALFLQSCIVTSWTLA